MVELGKIKGGIKMPSADLSFQDAFTESKKVNQNHHILLGNGFSRSIFDNIFSYTSILDDSDFSKCSENVKPLFERFKTSDFESIVKSLEDSSEVLSQYSPDQVSQIELLKRDAQELRNILASTLAKHHPKNPSEITEAQYYSCREFLRKFDRIMTLNYDLLLYWVLMKELNDESMKKGMKIKSDDGFRHGDNGEDFVVWDGDYNQNIYYLHGALHLFQGESELKKYTWSRTNITLLDQINDSLSENLFPLFVSHGTSNKKRGQILRNGYLTKCLRGIYGMNGAIFVFGASLPERDFHILKAISKSKVTSLYVGLWGDEDSPGNKETKKNVEHCQKLRSKPVLNVKYYDAQTVKPWGS